MAEPIAIEHAQSMLDHLRNVPAGQGHELARAMLAAAGVYLREVFGQQHAVEVAADLLPAILGVADVLEALPGEITAAEVPRAVLH